MSKVEIIYLQPKNPEVVILDSEDTETNAVIEEEFKEDMVLTPRVTVHDKIKKQIKKPNLSSNRKKHIKKHKNVKRIFSFFVVISLFGVAAFNLGYLPITALLEVPEPIGCADEINVKSYMKEYPALKSIPKLNNIKYKIFVSDASLDTVANNFEYKLKREGYSVDYEGVITKKGITFHYYGFVKGITAIGILLTDDVNGISGHKTAVLSTIGSVYDYKDIISWYKSNLDL